MKKKSFRLSLVVFALAFFGNTNVSFAQKIKVKKIKGNTALIEMSTPLEEGQSYDLQTTSLSMDVNYSNPSSNLRSHSLTLGLDFSSLKGETVQENSFSAQGRYGWNFSNLELCVVGGAGYLDTGAGAIIDFSSGGYLDYNLIPNQGVRSAIYGPFGLLTFGSKQFSAGGNANLLTLNGGGFFSYFIHETSTALRLEGFINLKQVNAAVGQSSLTGFGGRGLLVFYY